MDKIALKRKVQQLHEALNNENVSYSELVELDSIAQQLGIKETDEMSSVDVLIEVEGVLNA